MFAGSVGSNGIGNFLTDASEESCEIWIKHIAISLRLLPWSESMDLLFLVPSTKYEKNPGCPCQTNVRLWRAERRQACYEQ